MTVRIFFATDLHGSELCFRKFCAAAEFYNCELLILGGDMGGKQLVPITVNGSKATHQLGGLSRTIPLADVEAEVQRIANMGYYALVGDERLLAELEDPSAYEARLLEEVIARARSWVQYADTKLGGTGHTILVAPGNDDDPSLDVVFEGSSVFINAEGRVLELDGIEVLSTGWSNPTPWNTPRECTEEELERRLREVVASVREPEKALFNFHVPPHGTTLDVCPQIDDDFRVVTRMGMPLEMHAGSTAVRRLIEEHQPLASLHGHIHESRNATRLGRTLALNPGSDYAEGVLMGAIVEITKDTVRHEFTAG